MGLTKNAIQPPNAAIALRWRDCRAETHQATQLGIDVEIPGKGIA